MFHRSRAIFLFLTIVAVVLVSAVGTTNVYADDGTPPPPPAETEVVDPSTTEGDGVAEATPVATEVPVEPVVTEAPVEPVVTEAPVEPVATEVPTEAAPAAEPVAEEAAPILEQLPDNTTVTVVNAEGEAQPLSSEESAQAILTGDPIWCPSEQHPGNSGCTQAFPNFSELLAFLDANEGNIIYQRPGTIWVEMGAYTGPETSIDFNSYDFTTLNQFDLGVQGAWAAPGAGLDTTKPTEFKIPITIGSSTNRWGGSLTFNNISISDVYNQTGLTLFSKSNIILTNVTVTGSQGGAELNAGGQVLVKDSKFNKNKKFGAKVNAGGYVSITGREPENPGEDPRWTEFTNNGGSGLEVDTLNSVTLQWVKASNNAGAGADINASGFGAAINSVFEGNISYTYTHCGQKTASGGYGVKIVSGSSAYLDGVTANKNYLFGAYLEAPFVTVYNDFGDNFFNNNGLGTNPTGYGLKVVSTAAADALESDPEVYITNVEANGNREFGANIQAAGDVYVANSFFDGNKSYKCSCSGTTYYGYGIEVVSTGGTVQLSDVSASGNNLVGAHLKGTFVSIGATFGSLSTFNNNGSGTSALTGKGLEIESTGEVALANVAANNNQLFGAKIVAGDRVEISNGFFSGQEVVYSSSCKGKTVTGGYGLDIVTTGPIALAEVTANDNYLYGAHLKGSEVAIATGNFNSNKEGLNIDSIGDVEIADVHADGNLLSGANVQSEGFVDISLSTFSGNLSSTYSSCKGTTYQGYGLKVVANKIKLSDVTADKNYVYGALLQGTDVKVGYSSFSNNGTGTISDHIGKGLEIVSTGTSSTVDVFNVKASYNQLFGANIQADGLVLVNDSVFTGNKSYTSTCSCKTYDGYGLRVVTKSAVYATNVTANENYLYGAHLEGTYVKVSNSSFNLNASPLQSGKEPTGRGLEVVSSGDALLKYVNANNNQLFGANVQAGGKVEVFSSVFADNKYSYYSSCKGTKTAGYGLTVTATGPITLASDVDDLDQKGVRATGNGAEGAILVGQSTVDVTGGEFSNNGASGLSITATQGNVTLNNVTASNNKVDGVDVTGACAYTTQVNGGTFKANSKYGLKLTNVIYATDGTQDFSGNGSGNVFQSGCTTTTSTTGSSSQSSSTSTSSGSSQTGQSHWYWYGHQWHWH